MYVFLAGGAGAGAEAGDPPSSSTILRCYSFGSSNYSLHTPRQRSHCDWGTATVTEARKWQINLGQQLQLALSKKTGPNQNIKILKKN